METANDIRGRESSRTDGPQAISPTLASGSLTSVNVHRVERRVSIAFGGLLLALGLGRRSLEGLGLALAGGALLYRGISGHSFLYQACGISTAEGQGQRGTPANAPEVERAVTINASAGELERFWRDPQNLSRILGDFAEVTAAEGDRMRWALRAPLGQTLEWETQIVEDRPGELLRWASVAGASVPNEGTLRFRPAPGDRGTEVLLTLRFGVPGGALGGAVMNALRLVPGLLAEKALRHFKSLVETGEMPRIYPQPVAR